MLDRYARGFFAAIFTPVARVLARAGVTPDAVTITGSLGASAAALILYPCGQLFWGTVAVTVFIFSDMIDGLLARLPQEQSSDGTPRERPAGARLWGSFLDSTLDRVVDFAIFGAVAFWFFAGGGQPLIGAAALICLCLGALVSYARAKAESLGLDANVGFAERSERLVAVLVFTGFTGLGLTPWALFGVLILLAVASAVTVGQRVRAVWLQTRAQPA